MPPAADAEQGAIAAGEAPSQVSVRGRRRIAVAAGLVVVSGAGGLLAFERFMQPEPDAVMLTSFDVAGNAPLARTFAAGVSAEVNSALSAAGVNGSSSTPR
jgi:hypothetical protein